MCSKIGKISEHQSTVNVDACTVKVQGIHCCIDVGVCRYLGTATESLAPSLFMVTKKLIKLTAKLRFIKTATKTNIQNYIFTRLVEMKCLERK